MKCTLHLFYIFLVFTACYNGTPDEESPLDPDNITGLFLNYIRNAEGWVVLNGMKHARYYHQSTLLQDGRVLVSGGYDAQTSDALSSLEIYNPSSQSFSLISASFPSPIQNHTATLLQDGRVLIVGGSNASSVSQKWTYIYSPVTGSITVAADMNIARRYHKAIRLNNGKVLVSGGNSSGAEAEVYDPVSNGWTTITNGTIVSSGHNLTLLSDGRVLQTGGVSVANSTRIFSADGSSSIAAATMNISHQYHVAHTMSDGTVLVAGGANTASPQSIGDDPEKGTEIYSPNDNTFTIGHNLALGREKSCLVQLKDGRIMIIGGINYYKHPTAFSTGTKVSSSTVEFYSQVISYAAPSMNWAYYANGYFQCTALNTGDVLVTGVGVYPESRIDYGTLNLFARAELYRVSK
ncbi:MAG: hypothetical protein KDK39_16260 [Leptospiraceae bacterium]|nr:hypothetical protein [Leptospiraceae bacterium]